MASTATSATLFLVFNLLFFTTQVTSTTPPSAACPVDIPKFSGCGGFLNGAVHGGVGPPPDSGPCCTLINGLVDLEAAVCVCTAIKTNVLGINLDVPLSLSSYLNYCGKSVPEGYQCA